MTVSSPVKPLASFLLVGCCTPWVVGAAHPVANRVGEARRMALTTPRPYDVPVVPVDVRSSGEVLRDVSVKADRVNCRHNEFVGAEHPLGVHALTPDDPDGVRSRPADGVPDATRHRDPLTRREVPFRRHHDVVASRQRPEGVGESWEPPVRGHNTIFYGCLSIPSTLPPGIRVP